MSHIGRGLTRQHLSAEELYLIEINREAYIPPEGKGNYTVSSDFDDILIGELMRTSPIRALAKKESK